MERKTRISSRHEAEGKMKETEGDTVIREHTCEDDFSQDSRSMRENLPDCCNIE